MISVGPEHLKKFYTYAAPKRYTHGLIEMTREFVVNFPPWSLLEKVHHCG